MGTQPAGGSYDDVYDKLQTFVGAVRATTGQLDEHQAQLHTLDGALQQMDGTAEQVLGQVIAGLEQHKHELEAAQHETEGQLQSLAHALEAVAERVATVDHQLETDEQACLSELAHEQAALEQEYQQLAHDGFEALHGVLSTIEGDLEGAQQSVDSEFAALESALQEMQGELEQAASAASGAIEAEAAALGHSEAEFAATAAAAVQEWSTALPAQIEQGCSAAVKPAEEVYDGLESATAEKGDALLKTVESTVRGTITELEEDAHALQQQARETEGMLADHLEQEMQQTRELADTGSGEVTSMCDSLFGDLDYALKIADRVAELFKEVAE